MTSSDRPIDKSIFVGSSEHFSLDEALRDAMQHASAGGADILVGFQINRIFGHHGGIAGLQTLCVEIRVDDDVSQDVPSQGAHRQQATQLAVCEPVFEHLEIGSLHASPTQFVLRAQRTMPTPGWTFHIDSVKRSGHHITVQLTDVPPEGPVVQTLGPTPLMVQLGALRAGRYVIEIFGRKSPQERHQLLQATVVSAH